MGDNIAKNVPKFDGSESTDLRRYSSKLCAYGTLKGQFNEALEAGFPIMVLLTAPIISQTEVDKNIKKGGQCGEY